MSQKYVDLTNGSLYEYVHSSGNGIKTVSHAAGAAKTDAQYYKLI